MHNELPHVSDNHVSIFVFYNPEDSHMFGRNMWEFIVYIN
jgi:hypothetical protein